MYYILNETNNDIDKVTLNKLYEVGYVLEGQYLLQKTSNNTFWYIRTHVPLEAYRDPKVLELYKHKFPYQEIQPSQVPKHLLTLSLLIGG